MAKDDEKGITKDYNPPEQLKNLRDMVYDRYQAMKDSPDRKEAEKEWEAGRKAWEAIRREREDEDDWQSNHYAPMTTAVIETALSEAIDQSPAPMILPRGFEDNARASVMEHVYRYSWEISDSDLAEEDVMKDALTEGTGIGQEMYYRDVRPIHIRLKEGSKYEYEEEQMTDYDDVLLDPVKNDDFFVDENARGFTGFYAARDCVRRFIMNKVDYDNFFKGPIWDPFGAAKFAKPGGDTNYYEKYHPPQGIDHGSQIEMLWYWSVKPKDWLIIVANDVITVAGPNPFKHKQLPFARAIDVRRTHKFYGKGEPKLLESIQDEVNTFRRMVIDRNHLDIDKMFYGSSRVNLSDEESIARPHGFITVPDGESIKPIEYNDIPRSVELSLKHLEDDATIVTGINPRAQALPTTGTATEAAILKESTLKRIRLKMRRFEREFLNRTAKLRVSNILQYYGQPKLEKIVGEEEALEFQNQIKELEDRGLLVRKTAEDGTEELYRKRYRDIRLENKEVTIEKGQPKISESNNEYNFFEAEPKYFFPNKGGYDIKIVSGPMLTLSKPLMQQRKQEMFDRLIKPALGGVGWDPVKLGDMLLRANDENPADYKLKLPVKTDAQARVQSQIELANVENKLMMQGKLLGGTPYVGPIHTSQHTAFMGSDVFQQLEPNDPRVQGFTKHITEELASQAGRGATPAGAPGGSGESMRAAESPNTSGGANDDLAAMLTGKIQGGEQVAAENPAV